MMRGLWATLALEGADRLERRLLGRRPVYDARRMGERLFGNAAAGVALRFVYGPALSFVQRKLRVPALLFGPLVAMGELLAMPLSGATPKVRKWGKGEVPLLFAHATLFALASAAPSRGARGR